MIRNQTNVEANVEVIVERNTMRLSTIAAGILTVGIGFIFLVAQKTPAQGAELLVVVSDGMKPSVEELVPQIEHSIGRKLTIDFNSSKALREKIQSGEPFDVAILTSDIIDDLIKQGKIVAGRRAAPPPPGWGGGVSPRPHTP